MMFHLSENRKCRERGYIFIFKKLTITKIRIPSPRYLGLMEKNRVHLAIFFIFLKM